MSRTDDPDVQHFVDFMRTMRMSRNGRPTFDEAINLAYIYPENITRVAQKNDELSYRYTIEPELLSLITDSSGQPQISLGTHVAVMDQVTSCAMSMVRLGSSGVSVTLEAKHVSFPATNQVDVYTKVTKMGRNLAFCRVEIRNVNDGGLVCTGSHINFLNIGGNNFFANWLLSKGGFPYFQRYQEIKWSLLQSSPKRTRLRTSQQTLASILLPYLKFDDDTIGKATFQVMPPHENYGSGFHGGCQAIVMELVGLRLASSVLETSTPLLESIEVKYKSRATGRVFLDARVMATETNNMRLSMLIELTSNHQGRILSEGFLVWSNPNTTTIPSSRL